MVQMRGEGPDQNGNHGIAETGDNRQAFPGGVQWPLQQSCDDIHPQRSGPQVLWVLGLRNLHCR